MKRSPRARVVLALMLVCACRSYDPGLLRVGGSDCDNGRLDSGERCDTAIAEGSPGACPTACDADDPCTQRVLTGSGCGTYCASLPVTRPVNDDGCCPQGVDAAEDSDCGGCGDGVIGPQETCDPPETCPSAESCGGASACLFAVLSGDPKACNSICSLGVLSDCVHGDGCCPARCNPGNDDDCSTDCGNMVIDAPAETCEPQHPVLPCPTDCDDANACTDDQMAGSPSNCNVECANAPITMPLPDDGCCPPGANASNDSDCGAICGNAVTEPGEDCDGGPGCRDCVQVFASSLRNRYSFEQSGTTAYDSIGTADGACVNFTCGGGSADLQSAVTGNYVELPAGILEGLDAVTVEVWLQWDGGAERQRIFDFGNSTSGSGTSFFGLTPLDHDGYMSAFMNPTAALSDGDADWLAVASDYLPVGTVHHVAVTFDGRTLALYRDGQRVAATSRGVAPLAMIDDQHNWLGRSQYSANAELDAVLYEVRIYGDALSDDQIEDSYLSGPDP